MEHSPFTILLENSSLGAWRPRASDGSCLLKRLRQFGWPIKSQRQRNVNIFNDIKSAGRQLVAGDELLRSTEPAGDFVL